MPHISYTCKEIKEVANIWPEVSAKYFSDLYDLYFAFTNIPEEFFAFHNRNFETISSFRNLIYSIQNLLDPKISEKIDEIKSFIDDLVMKVPEFRMSRLWRINIAISCTSGVADMIGRNPNSLKEYLDLGLEIEKKLLKSIDISNEK